MRSTLLIVLIVLAGCSGSRVHTSAPITDVEERTSTPTDEEPGPKILEYDPADDAIVPGDLRIPLSKPEKVTFYTIAMADELEEDMAERDIAALPELHGYRVLGEAEIDVKTDGVRVINSLLLGVRDGSPLMPECYMPHHAIRVDGGGKHTTILVCFLCENYEVYPGDNEAFWTFNKEKVERTWREIVSNYELKDISTPTWEYED